MSIVPILANSHYWYWHSHYRYRDLILVLSFFGPIVGTIQNFLPSPNWQSAIMGTESCMFLYWHCPILVQALIHVITGPALSPFQYSWCHMGYKLCQSQYFHTQGPVPELHSEHTVPFLVISSASSGTVICKVPVRELHSAHTMLW